MSDLPPTDPATSADPPPPSRMDSAAERAVAKAEAAATRRRWITLAEGLAIAGVAIAALTLWTNWRSEEHTSELQSLMRISYAVFCLKKKKQEPAYSIQTVTHQII